MRIQFTRDGQHVAALIDERTLVVRHAQRSEVVSFVEWVRAVAGSPQAAPGRLGGG